MCQETPTCWWPKFCWSIVWVKICDCGRINLDLDQRSYNKQGRLWTCALPCLEVLGQPWHRPLCSCWFVCLWLAALKGGSKERQLFFWVKQQLVREKEAQDSGFRTCCASSSCCQCHCCHWCWGKRRTKRRRKRTRLRPLPDCTCKAMCNFYLRDCTGEPSVYGYRPLAGHWLQDYLRSSFGFSPPASSTKTKCSNLVMVVDWHVIAAYLQTANSALGLWCFLIALLFL